MPNLVYLALITAEICAFIQTDMVLVILSNHIYTLCIVYAFLIVFNRYIVGYSKLRCGAVAQLHCAADSQLVAYEAAITGSYFRPSSNASLNSMANLQRSVI